MKEDRSSDLEYEDCGECAVDVGSGICSNCADDEEAWQMMECFECNGTNRCLYCEGTGRRPKRLK